MEPLGGGWKMTNLELLEEKRIDPYGQTERNCFEAYPNYASHNKIRAFSWRGLLGFMLVSVTFVAQRKTGR